MRKKIDKDRAYLYRSMHAAIISAADFQKATSICMSPNSWPLGILIKRYFVNKKQNGVRDE